MQIIKKIKDDLYQILAVTEKDLKLSTRFKLPIIMSFITPILNLLLPLIVLGQIFTFSESFGPWDSQNFALYIMTSYQISIMARVRNIFPSRFRVEKVWKTLHAIIIAPFNRRNLLFGMFISYMIMNAFNFTLFFIISLFIKPISIISVLFLFIFYFFIALVFSGVGLFLGALAISKPSLTPIVNLGISILYIFSCLSYPFDFFPPHFQAIVLLDPFFYLFDFIRTIWLDDNIFLSIVTHPFHVFLIVGGAIIVPLVGLWIFNIIYNKYGVVGY